METTGPPPRPCPTRTRYGHATLSSCVVSGHSAFDTRGSIRVAFRQFRCSPCEAFLVGIVAIPASVAPHRRPSFNFVKRIACTRPSRLGCASRSEFATVVRPGSRELRDSNRRRSTSLRRSQRRLPRVVATPKEGSLG